ncbi:hypothetical protein BJV78DRAFT_1247789, partial [Lactifluus subvellereus]
MRGAVGTTCCCSAAMRGTCTGPALLLLVSVPVSLPLPLPGSSTRSVLPLPPYPCLSPRLSWLLTLILVVALSGTGLHGSSGRRDGKNRRGGTLVVFWCGTWRWRCVRCCRPRCLRGCVVESPASASPPATMLLLSHPNERRR